VLVDLILAVRAEDDLVEDAVLNVEGRGFADRPADGVELGEGIVDELRIVGHVRHVA
jgi:hypothetical protein